jgi:hypothetical protein
MLFSYHKIGGLSAKHLGCVIILLLGVMSLPAYAQETHGKKIETRTVTKKQDHTDQGKLETRTKAKPSKMDEKKLKTRKRIRLEPLNNEKLETHNPKSVTFQTEPSQTLTQKQVAPNRSATMSKKLETANKPKPGMAINPEATALERVRPTPPAPVDGRKLQTADKPKPGMAIDPESTTLRKAVKRSPAPVDGAKLRTHLPKVIFGDNTDGPQLYSHNARTANSNINDRQLMTRTVTKKRTLDDQKLMSVAVPNKKKAYWDDEKIMSLRIEKQRSYSYDPNKETKQKVYVYLPWDKVSKTTASMHNKPVRAPQIPYDARIAGKGNVLMKPHKTKKPALDDKKFETATPLFVSREQMQKNTKDQYASKGNYEIKKRKHEDMHPSARHMNAGVHNAPWVIESKRKLSIGISRAKRRNDLQPTYTKNKSKKVKFDKDERKLWTEDTRHPRPKEERAEID